MGWAAGKSLLLKWSDRTGHGLYWQEVGGTFALGNPQSGQSSGRAYATCAKESSVGPAKTCYTFQPISAAHAARKAGPWLEAPFERACQLLIYSLIDR